MAENELFFIRLSEFVYFVNKIDLDFWLALSFRRFWLNFKQLIKTIKLYFQFKMNQIINLIEFFEYL